jgi:ankyrin repeat protein
MAACLGDLRVATRLIDADPTCLEARINEPGYAVVPPLSIYCWSLGFGLAPHDVALKFGHREVEQLLTARSPAQVRFINAVLAADERRVNDVIARDPSLMTALPRKAHGHLAYAIFFERFDAAELMLRFGFDPAAPGMDGGSALHAACWVGNVRMVEAILTRGGVPIDSRDPTHQSTPLGWAAFGSVHRRAMGADYPAIVDRLVAAGADISAPGNGNGRTLLEMAQGNSTMQAALRRHGAT